jgi:Domain of Unknown Function (DUF1521)
MVQSWHRIHYPHQELAMTVAAFAAFNPALTLAKAASRGCFGNAAFDPANPTNASTSMQGGKVAFENDNYRITMGDDNTVDVYNKNTGENYLAWGDPHMNIDGQHTFDFWGTTTLSLDDGTKLTIETTPWVHNPEMTLSSKVTITSGDYAVQISGIDSNQVGDLKFEEGKGWGRIADLLVADGNVLYENPFGKGFLGLDGGQLQKVDQNYINKTDLSKSANLQARAADAFAQMAGLLSVGFAGSFLGALRAVAGDSESNTRSNQNNSFALLMGRGAGAALWLAALTR